MSCIFGYLQNFYLMEKMLWIHFYLGLLSAGFITAKAIQPQEFVQIPVNQSVIEGSTATLKCQVKNRVGKLQWTKNKFILGVDRNLPSYERYSMVGNPARDEFHLRIVSAKLEDDGLYQCQVGQTEEAEGIRSNTVKLTVLFPPDPPQILEAPIAAVILGKPTNITCLVKNGKPGAKITWYLAGKLMNRKLYSTEMFTKPNKRVDTKGNIMLIPKTEHSGKLLECHAINEALQNPYVTRVTLNVQYPPDITMKINITGKIRQGMNVQLACEGFANPQQIKWKWYRNGKHLARQTASVLNLPSISHVYHDNTITCEATNSIGSTRKEKRLDIKYGPRFISASSHVAVDPRENAKLKCEADGNPQPSIIWRKKGSHNILGSGSTLELVEVNDADLGTYYCTATVVGFSEISREVLLLKNGPPRIMSDGKFYTSQEKTAHIECIAISVPKPVSMYWMKNGRTLDNTNSDRFSTNNEELPYGMKSTLEILKVHKEDFGSYNCSVANKYGEDIAIITLAEKDVLPMPYIIGGAVGSVAVILIIILACVIYHRYKNTDSGADSYTDSDSTMEKKKDVKSESPTLMGQWRQDYNKDLYRYSDNFDEVYNSKSNNNAHILYTEPYYMDPSNREGSMTSQPYDYVSRPGLTDVPGPADRYESNYNRTFVPRSFKSDISDTYSMLRLPPADLSNTKFATNV
ncbi:kin of IRRE 1 isoform X1 [Octopus vulgaris]|uniref:Kin of IRRE 1 isoform X1 n=2 Tax=Octopus TaxID=6643 RepID=A0AA36F3D5_OCTVU|nr:irregular chiasm C-roughest protein [Octopus sinensis]XP_029636689.1 irregular chiasm C-roughest protein [Octopus sinensis]CAI9723007.1 kin of IRRE 1 isoform X1 [Octopus vulgaris]